MNYAKGYRILRKHKNDYFFVKRFVPILVNNKVPRVYKRRFFKFGRTSVPDTGQGLTSNKF